MRRRTAALLAALLPLLACRSPEEKLLDRRNDLRRALDALYLEYGRAGAPPEHAADAADAGGGGRAAGIVGRLVAELDRTHFEESCLALGRGDRPFLLSDRAAAFFEDPGHADACRRAARVATDVDALQREVDARARPTP